MRLFPNGCTKITQVYKLEFFIYHHNYIKLEHWGSCMHSRFSKAVMNPNLISESHFLRIPLGKKLASEHHQVIFINITSQRSGAKYTNISFLPLTQHSAKNGGTGRTTLANTSPSSVQTTKSTTKQVPSSTTKPPSFFTPPTYSVYPPSQNVIPCFHTTPRKRKETQTPHHGDTTPF